MTLDPRNIICDENQRFSCSGCDDRCCKSFSVKIEKTKKEQIENLDWTKKLLLENNTSFEKTDEDDYFLPIKDNTFNTCLFNDPTRHCLIHNYLEYDAKPVICQAYPFASFIDQESKVHLDPSFVCKSILENYGERLGEIKGKLVHDQLNLEFYPEEYPLFDGSLTQKEVFKLAEDLVEIFDNTNLSLDDRVYNYFLYLTRFKENYPRNKNVEIALEEAISGPFEHIKYTKPDVITRVIVAAMLADVFLFATSTRNNKLFKRKYKFVYEYTKLFYGFAVLNKSVKLPQMDMSLDLSQLRPVKFIDNEETKELIIRYLRTIVTRYKYYKSDNINLDFFNRVIYHYSLIKLISRIYALSEKSDNTNIDNVRKAVILVETVHYHFSRDILTIIETVKPVNELLMSKLSEPDRLITLIGRGLI